MTATVLAYAVYTMGLGCAFLAGAALLTPHRRPAPTHQLARRVPGAALVDNPPPDLQSAPHSPSLAAETVLLPLIARSPTIGQRQWARGQDAVQAYYESWRWADAPTQVLPEVQP